MQAECLKFDEIIDISKFNNICNNDIELAELLLSQLTLSTEEIIVELRPIAADALFDQALIVNIAHRLVGLSRYLCCKKLEHLASQLEQDSLQGRTTKPQLERLLSTTESIDSALKSVVFKDNFLVQFKRCIL